MSKPTVKTTYQPGPSHEKHQSVRIQYKRL